MSNLIYPDLYCPFPSQINKHVDVLESHAMEWVMRFNLLKDEQSYQRFRKSKFYWLAASAYPNCQFEELKIANDVISWLFVWDDKCDISDLGKRPELINTFCNRFIEILNGAETTSKDIPLSHALSDVRKRIIQKGNLAFFHHFVYNFEHYFYGCIQESNNRLHVKLPTLEAYIKIRNSTSAAPLCLNLIEFCDHLIIPYSLRNHEIVSKITWMTVNILAWSNDIFSLEKEISLGEFHNLVLVLKHQQDIPLDKALILATEIHNKEVQNLISLEASMPYFGKEIDAEIAKYFSGFYSWIRGNIDWYSHSHRYQITENIELYAS